jgi:hypothetical protein
MYVWNQKAGPEIRFGASLVCRIFLFLLKTFLEETRLDWYALQRRSLFFE